MPPDYDFSRDVTVTLPRDEAIALLWYLTRELWREGQTPMRATFENRAEPHVLEALLQELIHPLLDTGGEEGGAIHAAAIARVIQRYGQE
ncbi:MAG: hypothetical protein AB7F96_07140 [Beijerinckiaceae bacterium]